MENSKSIKSNTGYKGVHFEKENGKFRSQIVIRENNDVKSLYIGRYETMKESIKARENFIKSLF